MSRWFRIVCALFVCLPLLASCSTVVVQEAEPGASRETVSLDAMRFNDLGIDKPLVATIDANSPSYATARGIEKFAALSLPTAPSRRYLNFASKPFGGSLIYEMKTLVPVFSFLDLNRRVISVSESGRMERRESLFTGNSFEGRVTVPDEAKYVVIHGTSITPGQLTVFGGSGHSASVPGSRLGVLNLTLTTAGMATVQDSGKREDATKASIFYVASINGVNVRNAAGESQRASSGRGFHLTTLFPSRLVPAKPLKILVIGTHVTGAPIHALASVLAGTYRSVEAELDFTPEVDKTYVVRGDLDAESPTVWLEDVATGLPATMKGTSKDRRRAR